MAISVFAMAKSVFAMAKSIIKTSKVFLPGQWNKPVKSSN